MKKFNAIVILVVLLLSACDSEIDAKDEKTTAKKKRDQWEANKPDSYEYLVSRNCFCTPEFRGPIKMQIINHELDTAFYEPWDFSYLSDTDSTLLVTELSGKVSDLMIEALFSQILNELDAKPYDGTIEYDPTYFFPSSYFFDRDLNIADEEYGVTVSEFKEL